MISLPIYELMIQMIHACKRGTTLTLWQPGFLLLVRSINHLLSDCKRHFHFFLKLMQDPDLAQRAKKFILAHEVGHVLQDSLLVQLGFFFTVLCCVSCALIFFASQLSLPPLVYGITLVVSLNIAPQFFAKVIAARCFRFQESRADDFTHRVMGDIDAAKHSFAAYEKMLDVMDRRFAKQSVLGKIASILFNPDGVFHLTHPSSQERLENLREGVVKLLWVEG